jgi:formylglycine-generating enzyme required for sulfatase activity
MFWDGNILEGFPDETRDNSLAIAAPKPWNRKDFLALVMVKEPFSCVPVQTEPASVAFDRVLKEAGATRPRRDRIDCQLMEDVRNGTGKIIDTQEDLGGWPELRSEAAELDQDEDGMPDEWERKILREEQGDASGDADQDGYTNLEEYLNQTDPRTPEKNCQVDEEEFRGYQEDAVSLSVQGEKAYAEHLASQKEKREARKREIISTLKVTLSPSPGVEAKVVLVDLGGEASMEVIRIPSGSFIMGSPPEEEGQEKERPQHKVNISKPFYLASTPTTALQFRTVMGEEIRTADKTPDDFPAKETTWFEAQEFCEILSAITGQVFRLPSEAEWEYACRAGTSTAFYTGDVLSTDQANFNGAEATRYNPQGVFLGKETAVKSYPSNPWGLYDMPGNQAEWCQDFAYRCYSAEEVTDPMGTEDRSGRVLRGGKAGSKAWYLRSAARYSYAPEIGYGFRVVMEAGK